MITIDALRICDGERTLLDGVTMHLPANAVHGIAGEGRSALLQAMYGLVTLQQLQDQLAAQPEGIPCGGATWGLRRRNPASGPG